MMKEIADTTLESLLSLALGTPEIGAVNFNYLYEVILQILKHLGISEKILNHESQINKVARLSSIRLSSNILPKDPPNNELISSHEDTSPALPEPLLSTLVKNEESAESSGLNLLSNSFEIPNAASKKSIANVERNPKTSSNHIKLTEQEKSIVNLKRRDSETPTSDMWQILNKRLEGLETAVKETMNFINNIHSSSEDLKRIPTDVTSSSTISSPEEFVNTITERVRQLGEKILDMEEKLSAFPTKAELNCVCTEDKVVALIKEYSDLFNNKIKEELRINKDEIRITKDELSMNKDENKEPKTKVSVKQLEYSDERQNFDAKDVKSSNTSIVNAFSNKAGFLEENIATVKEKIQKLETSLASKPDMQLLIDLKTDLREINRAFQSFTEKFTDLSKQSTSLEKSHSLTSGELGVLSLKQAEFEAQQKKMLKNMQQLEHNLEDVADNFNKKQSELLKLQPKINPIDETVITKIRSSIFDMQEQYSKLQQQIDSLVLKSSDNNTKFFDIQKLVESLKEKMIDKFDIESLIAHKADLLLVENKIDRNQFNAFVLEMEQNFKGIVQKVDETEVSTNKTINDLEQVLNTKTNKEELNELRNYIDFRFNSFKPKIFQIKEAQDEAAGSRKQLMKNCNCISCDRPVALQNIHPGLTLPYYDPLPVKKAFRPVTPFELQTIRHNQQNSVYGNSGRIEISKERSKLQKELLQLCGVKDLEELSFQTNRACGGAHTLIEQHKRNPSKQPMLQQEEPIDVLGRDGHIYKGNLQTPLADIPRSPFKSETDTAEPYENVESVISQLSNHKNGSPVET